jgi:RNA polymerase sigma-70 factor (ECF subfamily)
MTLRDATLVDSRPRQAPVQRTDPMSEFPKLTPEQQQRLAKMLASHFDVVWRAGRRAGLSSAQAEENAQEAFAVCARKLDLIQSGRERAFLLGVAVRLAQNTRRLVASQLELVRLDDSHEQSVDARPRADDLLAQKEQRAVLDRILDSMSAAFREVLTLYEIHDLTLGEIADALEIPEGTAASRLRRAREEFADKLDRYLAGVARTKEGT